MDLVVAALRALRALEVWIFVFVMGVAPGLVGVLLAYTLYRLADPR